jgi:hypothetical protein
VEPPEPGLPPDQYLRRSFKNVVDTAMLVPHVYKSFTLNFSQELLAESSVLGESGDERSLTLDKIISILEDGIEMGLFAPFDVPLTAKTLWAAMFGLFFRLVVEPQVTPEEREALIQRHLDILLKGISA